MNVIIYCRVSSDEQTLGASLDVQEERLRKYCNQMGYNIINNIPYREDESAKTFEKRPVIQGIMSYIRKNKGKVNKLLFLRWDRYSHEGFAPQGKREEQDLSSSLLLNLAKRAEP